MDISVMMLENEVMLTWIWDVPVEPLRFEVCPLGGEWSVIEPSSLELSMPSAYFQITETGPLTAGIWQFRIHANNISETTRPIELIYSFHSDNIEEYLHAIQNGISDLQFEKEKLEDSRHLIQRFSDNGSDIGETLQAIDGTVCKIDNFLRQLTNNLQIISAEITMFEL